MYQDNQHSQQYCALCFEDISIKGNFIRNEVLNDACCTDCRKNLQRNPNKTDFCGVNVYSEYVYQEDIRLAILRYKESNDQYLARIFLHPYWSYKFRNHDVVLVPSTKSSYLRRGFDHVELLAQKSGFKNIHHVFNHEGKQQQALKQDNDRSTVQKEIELKDIEVIRNKKILIIDDIITSGNTILTCVALLKHHVESIDVLTIARSPKLQGFKEPVGLPFI